MFLKHYTLRVKLLSKKVSIQRIETVRIMLSAPIIGMIALVLALNSIETGLNWMVALEWNPSNFQKIISAARRKHLFVFCAVLWQANNGLDLLLAKEVTFRCRAMKSNTGVFEWVFFSASVAWHGINFCLLRFRLTFNLAFTCIIFLALKKVRTHFYVVVAFRLLLTWQTKALVTS